MRILLTIIVLLLSKLSYSDPVTIIAAENFYGQVAKEIGGANVKVISIISNPNADPHLFATTTAINKEITRAQIFIYNGTGYDTWVDQILKSKQHLNIINVSELIQLKQPNDNPHIWYKPETMPALARHLTNLLIKLDYPHKTEYLHNLKVFLKDNQAVKDKISYLKSQYANIPVIATEPIYNYTADALGLKMEGLEFQLKIMNGTEPSPKILADYLSLLKNHQVKILFYNNQVTSEATKNILTLAQQNKIPVVGVTETMPQNISVNAWLLNQLNKTATALQQLDKHTSPAVKPD